MFMDASPEKLLCYNLQTGSPIVTQVIESGARLRSQLLLCDADLKFCGKLPLKDTTQNSSLCLITRNHN